MNTKDNPLASEGGIKTSEATGWCDVCKGYERRSYVAGNTVLA